MSEASGIEVPVVDLAAAHRAQRSDLEAAALRVLRSGRYLGGPEVAAFESEWAALCQRDHAAAVGSGHDALKLSLLALGVGPGDEVLVPAHTAVATWRAVAEAGARPVGVDPDPRSMLLDAEGVRAALGPRTAAVVVVHLYGLVADVEAIAAPARRRGVAVLEDAAQAHGARDGARPVGSLGDVAAFSFFPTKNLGAAGDGGLVVAADGALAARVRRLAAERSSRLSELSAALLRVKLRGLEAANGARRARAEGYLRVLAARRHIELPQPRAGTTPAWHQFVVRVARRDHVRAHLARHGIGTQVHYAVPPHRCPGFADRDHPPLPVADELARRVLSVPVAPHVDERAAARVCEALLSAVAEAAPARAPVA